MQMIYLLLYVDAPVVLVTFVVFHCFGGLIVMLLYFIENFLQFVKVETSPGLQLRMVSVAQF